MRRSQRSAKSSGNIPLTASLLLLLICFLWGANMVSIRISNQGIPPLFAALLRSTIASGLLFAYVRAKGQRLLFPRRDIWHAVAIGLLFGLDFLFLYWGLAFTHASRGIIFLYTHPFWVALGAHFLLPGDRLTMVKGTGMILAFAGIIAVYGARSDTLPPLYWLGDLMQLIAAVCWAATTLYIKRVVESRELSHYQTLYAQLFFSIPLLAAGSVIFERGQSLALTPSVVGAFAFQCLIVAFLSYLLWFRMIHRFSVSRLAAFTFLAPLVGVLLGGLILREDIPLLLWLGLLLVGAGIYLVNRP